MGLLYIIEVYYRILSFKNGVCSIYVLFLGAHNKSAYIMVYEW